MASSLLGRENDDDSLFRSVEEEEPQATEATTTTTMTTTTTSTSDVALQEAEREWLHRRVRVVWSTTLPASGSAETRVSVVRRGVATRVFWLSDRSALVASVLYDDGDAVDAEALVDLMHDHDGPHHSDPVPATHDTNVEPSLRPVPATSGKRAKPKN